MSIILVNALQSEGFVMRLYGAIYAGYLPSSAYKSVTVAFCLSLCLSISSWLLHFV